MSRWMLLAALFSCAPPTPTAEPPSAVPGRGAAYPMREPSPALRSAAAPFAGSCSFAKPPGEASGYPISISPAKDAAVFASSEFERGKPNRIGTLSAGGAVRAIGPVASSAASPPGYAVLVMDTSGRVCRGYVVARTVTRLH